MRDQKKIVDGGSRSLFESHAFHQGTTLLLAIHDEVNAMLWVANVGDSRGVMRSSGPEEVLPLSYDHKPNQVSQWANQ